MSWTSSEVVAPGHSVDIPQVPRKAKKTQSLRFIKKIGAPDVAHACWDEWDVMCSLLLRKELAAIFMAAMDVITT